MSGLAAGDEYVALGSSFAAGPLLGRRVWRSPLGAGRSRLNYAHLLAKALGLRLTDVTYSGATCAGILAGEGGRPAQVEAVGPDTRLVTVTCGGNDVGYVGGLAAARIPRSGRAQAAVVPPAGADDAAFDELGKDYRALVQQIRSRAPSSTVVLVDYLTILPPEPGTLVPGFSPAAVERARARAERLADLTRDVAQEQGCLLVTASTASHDHHAWSAEPWTNGARFSLRSGAPFHPRRAGMRAIAELIRKQLPAGL
jgi:lysophospholipase L1-like esterase